MWYSPSSVFDHYPICFEWMEGEGVHNYPFKFNQAWLLDEDFSHMVKEAWPMILPVDHKDDMDSLSQKLRLLKNKVK